MGKFRLDMEALGVSQEGIILEIGSEHGGGSTEKLNNFAKKHDQEFITVDFDPKITAKIPAGIKKFTCTGQDFLSRLMPQMNKKIAFVYLDNFDYEFPEIKGKPFVQRQKQTYSKLGVQMNNDASEQCHLEQAKMCHEYRTNPFYIMMDDTYRRSAEGAYEGKGALVVPWAIENDYELIDSAPVGCNPWDGYVLMRCES